LLEFSRITTRGKELAPTEADQCLAAAIDNLELAIKENEAQVVHDSLPTVQADEHQLTSLFQNLISNALKYRRDQPPEIHIHCRDLGRQVEFSVRDNGIGIDEEYYGKIFEIFKRLHGRQEYSGTGIGLAICKRIVERFGGDIRVASQPQQGSTFFFTLNKAPQ